MEDGEPQREDGGAGIEDSQHAGWRQCGAMMSRSVDSIVTFKQPFAISTQTAQLPAGNYRLTIEEELIEGLSFSAFHRTSTILEIPAIGTASAMKQYIYIATDDLDAALLRDERATDSDRA